MNLHETRKIEASSVDVQNLGTYFFASFADEEDTWVSSVGGLDPTVTVVTGTVTGVKDRQFTIDPGPRQLTVDTATMSYNPLDQEGYQRIKKGDRVSVTGKMDGTLFSSRELDATSVLTLSPENRDKKTSSPSGKKK